VVTVITAFWATAVAGIAATTKAAARRRSIVHLTCNTTLTRR
jgi:hypothetical protein